MFSPCGSGECFQNVEVLVGFLGCVLDVCAVSEFGVEM